MSNYWKCGCGNILPTVVKICSTCLKTPETTDKVVTKQELFCIFNLAMSNNQLPRGRIIINPKEFVSLLASNKIAFQQERYITYTTAGNRMKHPYRAQIMFFDKANGIIMKLLKTPDDKPKLMKFSFCDHPAWEVTQEKYQEISKCDTCGTTYYNPK